MSPRPRRGGAVLGVAISTTRVVAALRTSGDALRWHEAELPTAFDAWSRALGEALQAWRANAVETSVQVRIAVLAPLVEVRTTTLPPVDDADARRLLVRNAARHFLRAGEPVCAGVSSPFASSGTVGAPPMRVVAAAPARMVRVLTDATHTAGAQLDWITPASTLWPRLLASDVGTIVEAQAEQVEVWQVHEGELRGVRRGRVDELSSLLPDAARVLVIGDHRASASAQVSTAGRLALPPDAATAGAGDGSDIAPLAAWVCAVDTRSAATDVPLALIDESPSTTATRTLATGGRRLAVLVLALLTILFGTRLWFERTLTSVRTERAALADTLAARGLRPTPGDAGTFTRAVADSLATQPAWSDVLGDIAARLPDGASVRTLAARGDSVVLEGQAAAAAEAWTALDASERLQGVAVVGPVRRERAADGRVTERFTLRAGVRAP